ncbi:dihydroxyacetone kinase, phosphotransfer subunit [Fusobacterium gonidiaformans 3-1-5R]|uniref:phosphoenolpyruvate--glycerone phosphotransferase n=2 Tax=Fusobacterium TaxID=848 RepID=E5BF31_9FUSO|nr:MULTISPECIES: dihydroxyacetone kinase phosphoryl donor subunit DhaM [Fusobacterium]AVQ16960.1 diguanylate cyclase [Fusobacterium gonidiaformans ATCC 25563]EFS20712.1 dihydroxyacetone kinase, phosphotransfer subunit [Fusobacterium gonidiaformans 3-1-5R]EFS28805.1 dihydroxyacetone kinase, phosphotransfer subunit [Fusobacterium gonidiaformans ATCC 25563]KXA16919.1 dihydroxyacetone kinase, phosphotransfer subunit [Fusobacterium equinum]
MVGIVVVSHSKALAKEAITLAMEMKHSEFPLINGSGTDGDYFGSNPLMIKEAIEKAYTEEGVLVFVDLGSSVLNTQIAIDFLDDSIFNLDHIKIADAPLVEGLIAAVAINDAKASLTDIISELKEFKNFSKINE